MNEPENKPLDLNTVSAMMNLCENIEQERKDAALDPEQKREAYRQRLKEFYAREGVSMSAESIERAVDVQLENEASFQPPSGGLGWFAARCFIRREVIIGTACLVLLVLSANLFVLHSIMVAKQKAACRDTIEFFDHQQNRLRDRRDNLQAVQAQADLDDQRRAKGWQDGSLPTIIRNPEDLLKSKVGEELEAAASQIKAAETLVATHSKGVGTASTWKQHSAEEWAQIRQKAAPDIGLDADIWGKIEASLSGARQDLLRSEVLEMAGRDWNLLLGSIGSLGLPATRLQDVQRQMDTARGRLQAGQAAEATAATTAAQNLINGWKQWQDVNTQLQQVIAAAKGCSTRDDAAKVAIAQAINEAEQAVSQENPAKGQQARQSLREVMDKVNSQYEIRIVCRNGQRSLVERTHNETGGKRWYAIVEAVDSRGHPLNQVIKNRETGEVVTTTVWGEEISSELYQKIYAEKKGTGAIEDLSFGKKEAGYLEPRYTRVAQSTHRITQW